MKREIIDGRWELLESIGKGGMGEVFVARHTTLETTVALKLLKPELSQDASIREQMITEARAAAKVKHPNVVLVSDVGQTKDGAVFIVMEHVDGENLKSLLDREGPLAVGRARSLLTQIAMGLAAAHTSSVIHRDVKPANCVVATAADGTEVVKILDFGIAKILEDTNDTAKETPSTNRWFTRHYVAPEVEKGHASSERSDVYSFGVLAYRMLTGHYPYDKTFKAITPLEDHRPDVPTDLCELVRDMLELDPHDRLPSMSRVCVRLAAGPAESPTESFGDQTNPDEPSPDTAPAGRVAPRRAPTLAGWGRWALFMGSLGATITLTAPLNPLLPRQPVIVASALQPAASQSPMPQPAVPQPAVPQPAVPALAAEGTTLVEGNDVHMSMEPAQSSSPTTTRPTAPTPAKPSARTRPGGRSRRTTDWRQEAEEAVRACLARRPGELCPGNEHDLPSDPVTVSFTVKETRFLSPEAKVSSRQARACIVEILKDCRAPKLPNDDYEVRVSL